MLPLPLRRDLPESIQSMLDDGLAGGAPEVLAEDDMTIASRIAPISRWRVSEARLGACDFTTLTGRS